MLPWIVAAASVIVAVAAVWYARKMFVEAIEAIDEANATKRVYTKVLAKLERKFGEKRVGRVAREVLREVTNEVQAKENGVI